MPIAGLHLAADEKWVVPIAGIPNFATVSLFLFPVVYAALNFGLSGSLATAAWVVVLTLPDLLLIDARSDISSDGIQLLIVAVVAGFVGQRVEREQLALRRLKTYSARVLLAHEEERRRIAHELHDEPVQALVHLARRLEAIPQEHNLAPPTVLAFAEVQALAHSVEASLREISRGLRPPSLDDLGLVAAVRQLAEDVEEWSDLHTEVRVVGEARRLPPGVELTIFRVAQEALHNVEKHAVAHRADVVLSFGRGTARLAVIDDGIGFGPEERARAASRGSLGMTGMRERSELVGGRLDVSSQPGRGTNLLLTVPDSHQSREYDRPA